MKTLVPSIFFADMFRPGKDEVDNRTSESVALKDSPALTQASSTTSPAASTQSSPVAQTAAVSNTTPATATTTLMMTELHKEDIRYRTFENRWPHDFLSVRILAKTGFYYIGPQDQVKCFFCKVEVGHWEPEDNEVAEHIRWSPNCPLLKRRETANEPCEPVSELDELLPPMTYDVCGPCGIDIRPGSYAESTFSTTPPSSTPTTSTVLSPQIVEREPTTFTSLRHPDYPEYAIESARLRSFDDWPKTLKQKPKQLSDAGFFYTQKGDRVICFSCGGGLRDWDENDDPWEQHALWFSKCEYLKLVKGPEFIERVKANQAKSDEENQCGGPSSQESNGSQASASAAAQVAELMAEDDDPQENKLCDSRLCKICYSSEYNTAFFPCGHVVACTKCASSVTKCPLCRKPFEKVMRVFFS